MLTIKQILDFKMYYHTKDECFQLPSPGIYPDRKYSSQTPGNRECYREANGITPNHFLLLQVGSDLSRKGVGRSITAVVVLPEALRCQTQLFVVGQDKPRTSAAQAERMGVKENVHFFVGRDGVVHLMAAADASLHPAKQEAVGIVLVEAVAVGLPVLVMEVCGYAPYIATTRCGAVLSEPLEQHALDDGSYKVLVDSFLREKRAKNVWYYVDTQDPYSLPEHVADAITGELYG